MDTADSESRMEMGIDIGRFLKTGFLLRGC